MMGGEMTRHWLIIIVIIIIAVIIIVEIIITIIITPSKARSVNTDWNPLQLTAIIDISWIVIALAHRHHLNNHHNHLNLKSGNNHCHLAVITTARTHHS